MMSPKTAHAEEPKDKFTRVDKLAELSPNEILDRMVVEGIRPRDPAAHEHGRELLVNYARELIKREGTAVPSSVIENMQSWIGEHDIMLSKQLTEIMHDSDFQRLEAAWRGLHYFVKNSETGDHLKVRVLNVSKRELLQDFESATEFTESALWKKIYSAEFNTFGGDAYGALIGDFEFSRHPEDVLLLDHLSKVAAAAHAPFISAAGSDMFGMKSFTQMPDPHDLSKIFDKSNPENTKWLSFRESEDSRWVVLTMPRVVMRLPYGKATKRVDAFGFEEEVNGEHENYLWGNAAYALGARLTDAFAKYHWCGRIRGPEGGGVVEGLDPHVFKTREGDIAAKCPTETLIDDSRVNELTKLGFSALVHCKNTDYAAFFNTPSVQRPHKYDDPAANASAELSSKLEYLMVTSRIAHYLKAICRDKIGSFMSRQDCYNFLNQWISEYVLLHDDGSDEAKAKYPLREASIEVTEDKSRGGGFYRAVINLRPHLHLDEITVNLRLVADLPKAVK